MSEYPDMPTIRELGINIPNFTGWHAFWGPKNLPPQILTKLEAAAEHVINSPEFKQICQRTDMNTTFMSSAEATSFFASEYNTYKALANQLGMVKK
jgi:tripartite-type tricarboxylate transporter receptor subunit TctC